MGSHHAAIGIALLAGTLACVLWRYASRVRRPLPLRGWAGITIIVGALILQLWRAPWWLATYLTPVAWTGYLMIADGMVASIGESSRMVRAPRRFTALALASIPLWVIFELYNLRLKNWTYVGLPSSVPLRALGYAWSFATVWPAIYETADLMDVLGLHPGDSAPRRALPPALRRTLMGCGLVLLSAPALVPPRAGSYLFGAVFLGFIFLLDPILYEWDGPSLLREWEAGRLQTLGSFLAAGWLCGLLWEFFNYWSAARWIYIFPIGQRWKIFEMPVLGFVGFPAFALECRVMWEFLLTLGRRFPASGRRAGLDEPLRGKRKLDRVSS